MDHRRSLEELRLSRGLSVGSFPVGRTNLLECERGKRPGPALIRKLAKVYACSTDEIFSAWEETKRRVDLAAAEERAAAATDPTPTGRRS